MAKKILIAALILVIVLLSACQEAEQSGEMVSPSSASSSEYQHSATQIKLMGEEAAESELTPAFILEAVGRAEIAKQANLTDMDPVMITFQYDDGSIDTYTIFADAETASVWVLDGEHCLRLTEDDAKSLLREDAFRPLYLKEPMQARVFFLEQEVSPSHYRITSTMGHTQSIVCAEQSLPVFAVERAEDFAPSFFLEPDDYQITFIDREGAALYEILPGEYLCEIEAQYDRETWSGTILFSAKLRVMGSPELILGKREAAQGEVLPVVVRNTLDYAEYSLWLPHLNKSIELVEFGDEKAAIVQINITAQTGAHTLELRRNLGGDVYETLASAPYTVTETAFARQDLVTSGSTQAIYTQNNLNNDNERVESARSVSNPVPYWRGVFLRPTEGRISTEFGQMRYVNDKLQSRHSGLDLAAKENAEVMAPAAGKVVFADSLVVNGNTVIIDHGWNVFSSYSHLNAITVEIGDIVAARDVIGLVGSTGYSTGPHLHYTVMVNGYYIDPRYVEENDLLQSLIDLLRESS